MPMSMARCANMAGVPSVRGQAMLRRARAHNQLAQAVHRTRKRLGPATDQKDATDAFRMSGTSECDRKLYYGRKGAKVWTPFDPCTREKLEKGDLLHDYIRGELIPKYTPWHVSDWNPETLLETTYAFPSEGVSFKLNGHPDGILWRKGCKYPQALLEIKTTNTFSYKKTTGLAFQDASHWSKGYLIQGNRYANVWNTKYPEARVPAICLFLYNVNGEKDKLTSLPWRDYWFKPDTDLFMMDLRRLACIERSVRDGRVPERHYTRPDWQCRGCFYHRHCWEDDWKKLQAKAKQPRGSRPRPPGSLEDTSQVPAAGRPFGSGDVSR